MDSDQQEQILKGNFKVKNPIQHQEDEKQDDLGSELKKKVLASLGGSMVYMERTNLTWDGEDQK